MPQARSRAATTLKFHKVALLFALTPMTLPANAQTAPANTLLPQPKQITQTTGTLPITSSFTIASNAPNNPDLQQAIHRTLEALQRQTNTPLSQSVAMPIPAPVGPATMTIQVTGPAPNQASPARPNLTTDESYQLEITPTTIRLTAPTTFGAMHGLVTLQQLVQPTGPNSPNSALITAYDSNQNHSFAFPALTVTDSPRFPWRGLHLDVSRHFQPISTLYRTVDAMAEVKLNVFHLHLSDDQGFRLESKRFPLLTARGSDGLFYTQTQMLDLIEYARARGIRIVPEFDVPGHVTSWLTAMPEFSSINRPYTIARTFGIWDAALDPTKESTYKFLDTLIAEMAALFPDEYLHMGGDESNGNDWKATPAIVRYMQQHHMKSTDELQAYFSSRVLALVQKHGKQMIGWDEILQPNTPKDAVIQSWRGVESLTVAAKQGNRGILSAPYYLDAMKTSEKMYLEDPLPSPGTLTPEQEHLILGGEAAMWAEQITPQTVDSRLWPRTAALAERFWSPQNTRNIDSLYTRLNTESIRLDGLGVQHIYGPSAGLRQIAGSEEAAQQLAVLTSTLSPVPFYDRYLAQKTSQLTPMGNLVDYTRPDPALRWHLHTLVEQYLHGTADDHTEAAQQLTILFHRWLDSGPALDAIAQNHPLVNQVAERRKQLVQLGQLGLDTLTATDTKQTLPADHRSLYTNLLKQASNHTELTDFAILPPLQQLLDATTK